MKTAILRTAALILLSCTALAADEEPVDHLVVYQYALYMMPGYEGDPMQTARDLVRDKYDQFLLVENPAGPPTRPALFLQFLDDADKQYAPPDMQMIGYFGRGLTREQALAVQDTTDALIVNIAYPHSYGNPVFHYALLMMDELSRQHASLVWDEATREIFTPDAWREIRLGTWHNGVPSAEHQTTIHAYNNGEYVRAITLGMEKFGQPDIVASDFGWSLNRPIGNLMNLVTQTLVEGVEFNDDMSLDLDVSSLQHEQVRADITESLFENADGKVRLDFTPAVPEEGDPNNYLLEISFENGEGSSKQERTDALLSSLFGWEDNIVYVDHDRLILEASQRAKDKMPELRNAFNDGLEPGEYISVKAPFATSDGGTEWMWVEVIEWDGKRIRGLLKNEPYDVPGLKGGAEVIVDEDELFDYIRNYADGSQEGDETGRLIYEAQQR